MFSVVKNKCPRCKEGKLFCDQNPYNFSKVFLMPHHCDSCGLKLNPEPGFYYGAMYVGYALSVAYLTSFYVAMLVLIGEFSILSYLIFSIVSLLLLTPVVFRLSRSIWLAFFTKYDGNAKKVWHEKTKDKKIDNPCEEV